MQSSETWCGASICLHHLPLELAMNPVQVMQEVESHWRSGRSLPAQAAPAATYANPTTLQACFSSIEAALACRQRSVHEAQVSYSPYKFAHRSLTHTGQIQDNAVALLFSMCQLLGSQCHHTRLQTLEDVIIVTYAKGWSCSRVQPDSNSLVAAAALVLCLDRYLPISFALCKTPAPCASLLAKF